jgi:DNA-binding MarR family transcriptional regulator
VARQELREAAEELNSFAIHLLRSMSRVDAESGLTPARLSALSVVHFGGPLPLGRLARAEGVSSPTMSRVVDALCALGYAERRAHDVNGRVTMVAATPSGSALMRRAAARRADVITAALRELPVRQRDAVVRATAHLPALVAGVRDVAGLSRTG